MLIAVFLQILFNDFKFKSEHCTYKEPIDVVYTWVNGSDPLFIYNLKYYLKGRAPGNDSSDQRFDDKHELKFSLR